MRIIKLLTGLFLMAVLCMALPSCNQSRVEDFIDEKLDYFASVATVNHDEREWIHAFGTAFDEIVALGDTALPYLCEVGAEYADYWETDTDAYERCVFALVAAHAIDSARGVQTHHSPDGAYTLTLTPEIYGNIGDAEIGVLYAAELTARDTGNVICREDGITARAMIEWSEDSRYAIVCDRYYSADRKGDALFLDTQNGSVNGCKFNMFMHGRFSRVSEEMLRSAMMRYLYTAEDGSVVMWVGFTNEQGTVYTGHCRYLSYGLSWDPDDFQPQEEDIGTFLDSVKQRYNFDPYDYDFHYTADGWYHGSSALLAYNDGAGGIAACSVAADGIASVRYTMEGTAALDLWQDAFLVTQKCDDGGKALRILDSSGREMAMLTYLTDRGIRFDGIVSMEDDRVLVRGTRLGPGFHLTFPTQTEDMGVWYADAVPDTTDGSDIGETQISLFPDGAAIPASLNDAMTVEGIYALSCQNDGTWQIAPTAELTQLGEYMDMLYGKDVLVYKERDDIPVMEADSLIWDITAQMAAELGEVHSDWDCIRHRPDLFAQLVAIGEKENHELWSLANIMHSTYLNRHEHPEWYLNGVIAALALQYINPLYYNDCYDAPVGGAYLYAEVDRFFEALGSDQGIRRTFTLYDAAGTARCSFPGVKEIVHTDVEWTSDGRYAIVTDGMAERSAMLYSGLGIFDTERGSMTHLTCETVVSALGMDADLTDAYHHCRYLGTADGGLRIWFGIRQKDGTRIAGECLYDGTTGTVSDAVWDTVDDETDGALLAQALEITEIGDTARAYYLSDKMVWRFDAEFYLLDADDSENDGKYFRHLMVNGYTGLFDYRTLSDFAVSNEDAVVLYYLNDSEEPVLALLNSAGGGGAFLDVKYLTRRGMRVVEIVGMKSDMYLIRGTRLTEDGKLFCIPENMYNIEYMDSFRVYEDPFRDFLSDPSPIADAEAPVVVEIAEMSDLNPALVVEGIYSIPRDYRGDFRFFPWDHTRLSEYLAAQEGSTP